MVPRTVLLLLLVLPAVGCGRGATAAEGRASFSFVDVAADAGIDVVNKSGDPRRWYIVESNGTGAAWLDHDLDGDQDLFVGNGSGLAYHDDGARLEVLHDGTSRLYRNDGDLRFADVSVETGASRSEWINGIAVGDVENDGDPDVCLAVFGADVLLRNMGGRFRDATGEAGLGCPLWGAAATFGDADNDGDLDLYVANYCLFDPAAPPLGGKRNVWRGIEIGWGPEEENKQGLNRGAPDRFYTNDGRGNFTDATRAAGLELGKALCSYAAIMSDVDLDGWQDLLVANDLQPCNLFMNLGEGRFRDEGMERGFALSAEGAPTGAMGLMVDDFDGDLDQDVFKTNFDFEANGLYVNAGDGRFVDRAAPLGLAQPSRDRLGWGGSFFDADLDGDLDLVVANGHVLPQADRIDMSPWLQQSQLFEAVEDERGQRVFEDVTVRAGEGLAALRSARGIAVGDPDDDGDLDLLVVDLDGPPRLLENRTERRGRWLSVRTIGRISNRDGYGARIYVTAEGRTWMREVRATHGLYSSNDPRTHFGLGDVRAVERVEVCWPSGLISVVENPALDERLLVHEPASFDR